MTFDATSKPPIDRSNGEGRATAKRGKLQALAAGVISALHHFLLSFSLFCLSQFGCTETTQRGSYGVAEAARQGVWG